MTIWGCLLTHRTDTIVAPTSRGFAQWRGAAVAAVFALSLSSVRASAQDTEPETSSSNGETSGRRKWSPQEEHTPPVPDESLAIRVALEELGILAAGTGYYFLQHEVNSLDWTYDYSWATLEAKLVGDAYSFDTNIFTTNTLAHSGAGTLYYIAARGNYLSPLESLGVGFLSSAVWEIFAEFRERISINDQIVTPIGGFAFGEAMTQVGRLFMRGCPSTTFSILSAVFAPSERLHRAIDGTDVARARYCDANGFAARDDYLVRMGLGASLDGKNGRAWGLGFGEIRVMDVPRNQTVQEPWRSFADGGIAELGVRVEAAPDEMREVDIHARGSLFGLAYRDVASRTTGVLALGAGIGYSQRRYLPAPAPLDPFFVIEAPALLAHWRRDFREHRLEVGLVAGGAFGEVGGFALDRYLEEHDRSLLTPVAANRGYNHGMGLTMSPHVRWSSHVHELWVGGRVDRLWAIRDKIGDELGSSPLKSHEARRRLRVALSVGTDEQWRFRVEGDFLQRIGTLGDFERKRMQLTWTGGLEGRF